MAYTPSDFSIEVIDLFGVILPGTVLAVVLLDERDVILDGLGIEEPASTGWQVAGLLVAGYVLGTLLRALGEYLDIYFYGNFFLPAFKRANEVAEGVPKGKPERPKRTVDYNPKLSERVKVQLQRLDYDARVAGRAVRLLKPIEAELSDPLLEAAENAAKDMGAAGVSRNTWGWADDYLRMAKPLASKEVARLTAQSKFFRSLALLLPFVVWQAWGNSRWLVAIAVGLIFLSLHQYARLRWKATNVLYQSFVMLRTEPSLLDAEGGRPS